MYFEQKNEQGSYITVKIIIKLTANLTPLVTVVGMLENILGPSFVSFSALTEVFLKVLSRSFSNTLIWNMTKK